MITVRLFAILKEQAGTAQISIHGQPSTVDELLPLIAQRLPAIADLIRDGKVLVARNQELVSNDAALRDGDEVAFLPPFSGGHSLHGHVRIQTGRFSLDAEVEQIKRSSPSIGGIATFLGTTRDLSRGTRVTALEFEHYAGMAERTLGEIRERAIRDYGIIDASIIHRVGRLEVGEDIVLIVVAAGHRDEAFTACRFCIDELKRITPIWKKETAENGVVWVEENP